MRLIVSNLNKSYGNIKIINNISFSLSEGVCAILGPNGSGKTSLLNILTYNGSFDSGNIYYNGLDIYKISGTYKRDLAYVPQTLSLYPDFNVIEYLNYIYILKGLEKNNFNIEANKVIKALDLDDYKFEKIGQLSEGVKRRVMVSQALLGNPKVIILDEPTAGLDPVNRIKLKLLLKELGKSSIVIIATHIVSDVENISNKILLLKEGKIHKELERVPLIDIEDKISPLENEYMNIFEN